MGTTLRADLDRLAGLAYHRLEGGKDLVRSFHRVSKTAKVHPDFQSLEQIYEWLFVPITLWPIDLAGLIGQMIAQIESGKRLGKEIALLLKLLPAVPSGSTQTATARHEHEVQPGNYESLIQAQHKFDDLETQVARAEDFQADWGAIKASFDVKAFQDYKAIVRRRLVGERSMRSKWEFRWGRRSDRFREVFDVFCQRWNLYGMHRDRPLLMKLTVNLTPFGTMIFIPSYWSFDPKRDVNWRAITALHKARGVSKQGPKLTAIQRAQYRASERATRLWADAAALGLKGEARISWVLRKLGLDPRTDERTLRRMRARNLSIKRNGIC